MVHVKIVGFDLDDCLFNSTKLSENARVKGLEAMIRLGLDIHKDEGIKLLQEVVQEYGSNSSRHFDFFLRRLNELENISIPLSEQYQYIAAAVIAYHKEKIKSIKLYDDVEPSFKKLKEMNLKIAIISDGLPVKQYEKIIRLNLIHLVDHIIISDEIGVRKPNPRLFDYCLKKFNIKYDEMIYVGDNLEKDIIPAKMNNIISIYIHRGGKHDKNLSKISLNKELHPDYEIYNLEEIIPIVQNLNN